MNDAAIVERVRGVVRRHLDVAGRPLAYETRFVDDLGADSLALVDLTLALEEAFDIDIEDADVEKLRTIEDAVRYVEGCLALQRKVARLEPPRARSAAPS